MRKKENLYDVHTLCISSTFGRTGIMDHYLQLGDILGMLYKEKQAFLMGTIARRTLSVHRFSDDS